MIRCYAFFSALLLAAGAASPETIFKYAREYAGAPITVDSRGDYAVWVWAPAGTAVEVEVGSSRLNADVPTGRQIPKGVYTWHKCGETNLRPGDVELSASREIAAVALSTNENFRPGKTMQHMRVMAAPEAVPDGRATLVRGTDTVFRMPHYASVPQWENFADKLRRRILLASGVFPWPEQTPLNARIFDRIDRDGYSVSKAYFEASPGFFVTGNLYMPEGEGPFPAAWSPHGHWSEGRLADDESGSVPARCITLARMGVASFSVDMVGYNDSLQVDHRWSDRVSALWGIHPFALQLLASIRGVDFLQSLPQVDPDRIACTGASGGGTQTFALMAVDPRVKVAAPVNMISSTMQGGCVCENAPIIRLDNSNMEIGALMAPRPLLLVSATGDWTRETPRVEYPSIRSVYGLYGVPERVHNVHVDAGHNYNRESREAMYRFFGRWLLNEPERWAGFTEPAYSVEPEENLRVFPDGQLPEGALTKEEVIASLVERRQNRWNDELPATAVELAEFQLTYGSLLSDVTGAKAVEVDDVSGVRTGLTELAGYAVERWHIGRRGEPGAVPAILFRSRDAVPQDAVVIAHSDRKQALIDVEEGKPGPLVSKLIDGGKAVLIVDVFLTGEHHSPFAETVRADSGGFADTFLLTDTAYRIQDILTALAFVRSRRDMTGAVSLTGLEDAGIWTMFAGAIDGRVDQVVADANRFDASNDEEWAKRHYMPSIRSVGDVATAAALLAPAGLYVMDTGDEFSTKAIEEIYRLDPSASLTVRRKDAGPAELAAVLAE